MAPIPGIVVAKESFAGELGKEPIRIYQGDLFEVDHPAVAKWPHLFEAPLLRYPVDRSRSVEQATAGPGEKRRR